MRINKNMKYFRTNDPVQRQLRRNFTRSRNQAKHRGQSWNIDFEDYAFLWMSNENYKRIGRCKNDLHLARIDDCGDWHINNVQITTRGEHLSQRMLNYYGRK
jgi:hypothetical protein